MPLNKTKLIQDIKDLSASMKTKTEDTTDEYANKMADIIEAYIKSGDVVVSGIATAGSASAQTQTAPVTIQIT